MFFLYLHLFILTLKLIDPSTSANQQLSDTTLSNITIIATTTFIIITMIFEPFLIYIYGIQCDFMPKIAENTQILKIAKFAM